MAKTKQLKIRVSDEFHQLLASAWRHLEAETKNVGINTKSSFIINSLLFYFSQSKQGKELIEKFKKIEEIEWWLEKRHYRSEQGNINGKTYKAVESYFNNKTPN